MNKSKLFRVNYQTGHGSKGCITIYVNRFFAENKLSDSYRFLSFARTHCTREQQLALLAVLEEEKLMQSRTEERKRIEKVIMKIEAQTWGIK